jgi:hypothetical protein
VLDDSRTKTTYLYNALNTKYMNDMRIEMKNVLREERGTRPTSASITLLGGSTSIVASDGFQQEHGR